jgi:hypothetical protein
MGTERMLACANALLVRRIIVKIFYAVQSSIVCECLLSLARGTGKYRIRMNMPSSYMLLDVDALQIAPGPKSLAAWSSGALTWPGEALLWFDTMYGSGFLRLASLAETCSMIQWSFLGALVSSGVVSPLSQEVSGDRLFGSNSVSSCYNWLQRPMGEGQRAGD